MGKNFILTSLQVCCVVLGLSAPAEAKLYIAEPLLTEQPAYAGMRFYVYKPYNMPKGWYATFDGYPVTQNKDKVWVYGTYAGPNLTPTHYIVGSIAPSVAGLSPYVNPVQISSITTIPPLPVEQPNLSAFSGNAANSAKSTNLTSSTREGAHSTYVPDWLFNARFMALGRWKDSVDRVGILHKPNIPVAWRGNAPKVIYAWDGQNWYQMMARAEQRPVDVLKENLYVLTRWVNHNRFVWYETDVPMLSQQASTWGYYWMGEIMPR